MMKFNEEITIEFKNFLTYQTHITDLKFSKVFLTHFTKYNFQKGSSVTINFTHEKIRTSEECLF